MDNGIEKAMNPPQCSQQLAQIFTLQINQAVESIDYLNAIKQAVTENNVAQLNDLLAKNQLNPQAIEQTREKQENILKDLGYDPDEKGLDACILDCDNMQQLQTLKQTLTQKLQDLEKSLLINSLLVRKNQHRVRQSIRILSGHELSNTPATYSQYGNAVNNAESKHTLAKA